MQRRYLWRTQWETCAAKNTIHEYYLNGHLNLLSACHIFFARLELDLCLFFCRIWHQRLNENGSPQNRFPAIWIFDRSVAMESFQWQNYGRELQHWMVEIKDKIPRDKTTSGEDRSRLWPRMQISHPCQYTLYQVKGLCARVYNILDIPENRLGEQQPRFLCFFRGYFSRNRLAHRGGRRGMSKRRACERSR